jgi:hypothetical protein
LNETKASNTNTFKINLNTIEPKTYLRIEGISSEESKKTLPPVAKK